MLDIHTISILGCGWYGFALAENLVKAGYTVKGSSTSIDKFKKLEDEGIKPYQVKFESDSESYQDDFFKSDLLIISIPPKRSSGEAGLYPSKIQRIKAAIQKAGVKQVLFISSTGVYGDHNQEVDEDTEPKPDSESGKAILSAEKILKDQKDFAVTILRFGGLIGPGRDPARFFAGKKNIPNGKAPVNLIHLKDCIGVSNAIIQRKAFGYTFNACADTHPEKMKFYTLTAQKSRLEIPEFIEELNEWKIVTSRYLDKVLEYKTSSL
ncbi:SDR family oxidoreductase [Pedobacter sp. P351]|uniref:SDR family oxidoreductase n=1 Tax=Pedobacter superstes TaxID=3133441 RepID=UPI0030A57C4B